MSGDTAGGVVLEPLSGETLRAALPDLAALRIRVFREWPYLYAGDADYERRYLATFAAAPGAVVIGARDPGSGRMVGAATGCPLAHADPAFAAPFRAAGHDPADWFYFGESVLEPTHRGRGIGVAFFTARAAQARAQGFARACFCAVVRDAGDPRASAGHTPLDAFWTRRGYRRLDLTTSFPWREVDAAAESDHPMAFWGRELTDGQSKS